MALRHSYGLLAPIYDPLVAPATQRLRRRSVEAAGALTDHAVLIPGIGSGLDIPYLPRDAIYTGIDITPSMLRRAERRARRHGLSIDLQVGDVMDLTLGSASFDLVLMHLILAVVPDPSRALAEATRVARPGARIVVLDKFLRPQERAPLRRAATPLVSRIATRLDVVFEELLEARPELELLEDRPVLAGGWFRRIVLIKREGPAASE